MAQDLIADQDIGKNVAIMRGGEVFRDDTEGARVAIVLNDYFYDLNGVLVGHLKGRHGHRQLERTPGRREAIFLRGGVRQWRPSWRSRAKPQRLARATNGGSRQGRIWDKGCGRDSRLDREPTETVVPAGPIESLHDQFASPCRLVRVFRAI